ncbi:MAG: FtsQ-type POTRA domain-containing protein [Desulfobacterales bacterium]
MGRKRIRSNYYKNSAAKKRNRILQRLVFGIKTAGVIVALLLVSFVFIFSYDFLTQCDYFKAEKLAVTGTERLSRKQVLEQAQLKKGMNIISINLSMARKRLLAHSWITEAEVSRDLPSGIHIRIKEHQPLAVLDLGRKFLINTSGEIFKEMTASDPDYLPVIRGLSFSDINTGDKPRSIPFQAVMNVLKLGQKCKSILPYKLIKKIQVDREMGLTVYAFDRIKEIKIGYNDYPNKYDRLRNILAHLKKRRGFSHLESIDLNNLNHIVIQPTKKESPARGHKEV